jgi:penicillin-binding protein-related factor A (putative recombinase)
MHSFDDDEEALTDLELLFHSRDIHNEIFYFKSFHYDTAFQESNEVIPDKNIQIRYCYSFANEIDIIAKVQIPYTNFYEHANSDYIVQILFCIGTVLMISSMSL